MSCVVSCDLYIVCSTLCFVFRVSCCVFIAVYCLSCVQCVVFCVMSVMCVVVYDAGCLVVSCCVLHDVCRLFCDVDNVYRGACNMFSEHHIC